MARPRRVLGFQARSAKASGYESAAVGRSGPRGREPHHMAAEWEPPGRPPGGNPSHCKLCKKRQTCAVVAFVYAYTYRRGIGPKTAPEIALEPQK